MSHWTDFFPYFAMAIKLIALGIAGFFAIKWHFDQEKIAQAKKAKDSAESQSSV